MEELVFFLQPQTFQNVLPALSVLPSTSNKQQPATTNSYLHSPRTVGVWWLGSSQRHHNISENKLFLFAAAAAHLQAIICNNSTGNAMSSWPHSQLWFFPSGLSERVPRAEFLRSCAVFSRKTYVRYPLLFSWMAQSWEGNNGVSVSSPAILSPQISKAYIPATVCSEMWVLRHIY